MSTEFESLLGPDCGEHREMSCSTDRVAVIMTFPMVRCVFRERNHGGCRFYVIKGVGKQPQKAFGS